MSADAVPVRVFVSYAHTEGDVQKKRVTGLVDYLRTNGIDAHFDQEVNGAPSARLARLDGGPDHEGSACARSMHGDVPASL